MERLLAATESSRLQWTKSGEEIYLTNVVGFSITISSTDGDGHPPYRLSILDDQAIELTGVDWKVDRTPYGSLAESEQNEYLSRLYGAVRASVVDVKGAVEKILSALDAPKSDDSEAIVADEGS